VPSDYDLIGPWTEVKLDILREYAVPYSKILVNNHFYHFYIDAFAAGGSHISRTSGEVVPGSARIALLQSRLFVNTTSLMPNRHVSSSSGSTQQIVQTFSCMRAIAMIFCCVMSFPWSDTGAGAGRFACWTLTTLISRGMW